MSTVKNKKKVKNKKEKRKEVNICGSLHVSNQIQENIIKMKVISQALL